MTKEKKELNKILVDLVDCPSCLGKGFVFLPPYYSIPMPKERKERCERCGGKGKLYKPPIYYNADRRTP